MLYRIGKKRVPLNRFQTGFTLVEMLIVVVILGILIGVALPNFIGAQERARLAGVKTNMHNFQNMVEIYAVDWNAFPDDYAQLGAAAISGGYAKIFNNPVTNQDVSFTFDVNCKRQAEFITSANAPVSINSNDFYTGPGGIACGGQVIYSPASVIAGSYAIYGLDATGRFLFDRSVVMLMSNS
ncbi:MAG: type II secretion system protein [Candidatus Sericytochromatia bacterium]